MRNTILQLRLEELERRALRLRNSIFVTDDEIAKQYYVNELISFVKLDDSIIKYINEYLDNVSSEFYLDEKELYDTDEEYQKAVWNQTFYEGGVAYCDLIKTIIKNL